MFGSKERVEVVAEDKDRFFTTVSEAADACKMASNAILWAEQFKEFLVELHEWCSDRDDRVSECFVAYGKGLTVFVITTSDDYDFDFDDELHALDLQLVQIYPDCPAEVLQIPAGSSEELNSFFSPERAVQAYGNAETAPG